MIINSLSLSQVFFYSLLDGEEKSLLFYAVNNVKNRTGVYNKADIFNKWDFLGKFSAPEGVMFMVMILG